MFPSKSRNRSIVSPKDSYVLGPQFTVQASSVTERANKQREPSSSVKAAEYLGSSHLIKRSASSGVDSSSGHQTHSAHGTQDTRTQRGSGHSHQRSLNVIPNHGKRPLVAATALAHDLTHGGAPNGGSTAGDGHARTETDAALYHHSTARTGVSTAAMRGPHSSSVFLPGDRVVFADSPSAPGVPIVYRTPEERSANPDRLNLDRRRLSVCPILEGEDQLRLLNYQHNTISRIQHLSALKRLIFLDLYDNQIEDICGLGSLRSLRVLMLGKNRIQKIENLDSLTKLDVLDLHGNEISTVENLNHLVELRVLNLAGNLIEHVDNMTGMDALTELNLRRNRIRTVVEVDALPSLQRLFLSFNEIVCFEDIQCLADSSSISELSLDGNPFAQDSHYKQLVVRYMQQIRQLDMKRVTEDERRIASVMARKEEEKRRETNKAAIVKERRRLAISNARRQWEVMQGSLMVRTNHVTKKAASRELYASHVGSVPNSDLGLVNGEEESTDNTGSSRSSSRLSRPTSAKSILSDRDWHGTLGNPAPPAATTTTSGGVRAGSRLGSRPASVSGTADKEKFSSGALSADYLSELDGDTLNLYGSGSLDALDKSWGIQAAGAVNTICFKFMEFDDVAKVLHKIRIRFPNVHTLYFASTNIHSLSQLNALSAVRRLDNLTIATDGNPVTEFSLWRTYLLFRLAHFCLKKINDVEVSASDIVSAEKFFGTMAHMTTSQLPQSRLLALLGDKKKQLLTDEKSKKSGGEGKLTDRTTESVGRAGLVYTSPDTLTNRTQDAASRQKFTRHYVRELAYESIQINQKQATLQTLWPQVFTDLVQAAVVEMWDTNAYMKKCMADLGRS